MIFEQIRNHVNLTIPTDVIAVTALMMVGIMLNFPAYEACQSQSQSETKIIFCLYGLN